MQSIVFSTKNYGNISLDVIATTIVATHNLVCQHFTGLSSRILFRDRHKLRTSRYDAKHQRAASHLQANRKNTRPPLFIKRMQKNRAKRAFYSENKKQKNTGFGKRFSHCQGSNSGCSLQNPQFQPSATESEQRCLLSSCSKEYKGSSERTSRRHCLRI